MPLLTDIVFFAIGFVLLTGGAEFLVRGASRLAIRMSVSAAVVGLTVVAFGTSLPELLVSLVANIEGGTKSGIAIGNIVGSNIANLGLILGVAAVLTVVRVERHIIRREMPLLLATSFIFVALAWNGNLGLLEGIVLTIGLLFFTYTSYRAVRSDPEQLEDAEESLEVIESFDEGIGEPSTHPLQDAGMVVIGLVALIFGADWLVGAAESLARALGVSELVIGLTLVALGTSLPELATTIAAVRQGEADIAVGNVVGSNLFNMLFIGGVTAIARPLIVPRNMFTLDLPIMLVLTGLVVVMARLGPPRLSRWQGIILLLVYFGYIGWLFLGAPPNALPT